MVTAIPLFAACAGVMAGGAQWDMDTRDELTEVQRITPLRVMNGLLSGQAGWDPYLYLRLPEEGLDVSGLPYLTVRLYSSGEADSLDVYYKCADETWEAPCRYSSAGRRTGSTCGRRGGRRLACRRRAANGAASRSVS